MVQQQPGHALAVTVPYGTCFSYVAYPWNISQDFLRQVAAELKAELGATVDCIIDVSNLGPTTRCVEITRYDESGALRNNDAAWRQKLTELIQPSTHALGKVSVVQHYNTMRQLIKTVIWFNLTAVGPLSVSGEAVAALPKVAEWELVTNVATMLLKQLSCTLTVPCTNAEELRATANAIAETLRIGIDDLTMLLTEHESRLTVQRVR